MQRQYYAHKITIRFTAEDVDFINTYMARFSVPFTQAVRMIMENSKSNLDMLTDKCEIRLIKGKKIPYVNKMMFWVPKDVSDLIDELAVKNAVAKQEAARFLIRLAEHSSDALLNRANFFIVR